MAAVWQLGSGKKLYCMGFLDSHPENWVKDLNVMLLEKGYIDG
jgi:hypothetical protein